MEIKYLGWSAFKIFGEQASVIIDPFDPKFVGLSWETQKADIVCVTHQHQDHNFVEGVTGCRKVIDNPGEYEVEGVRVLGFLSYHDEKKGIERGFNTIYRVEIDEFSVVHLGDLGQKLEQGQVEKLGSVDVLIIPVGGKYTIDYEVAAEIVTQIEPPFVIPCHYQVEGVKISGIEPLDKFLEEMGETDVSQETRLKLTSQAQLPEETEVVVLTS
ncbi:MBL fold metallo-hydrolase [Patescibacteria group bacterium]|nr:MBL fold metallo-hydrolase [Patescibacteria group bacterium]MBU1867847.1 MBL fold metallo-hydrolase [Patescibacteria group bacterium]